MKLRYLILGFSFAIVWSSAFTSARISVVDAPPFLLLSLRFFISGISAVGIAYYLGQSLSFTKTEWYAILIFGICQNTIYLGLNFVAMQWIDASLAATIASLLPLVVTIFLWLFFKEKITTVGIIGLIIGGFGIVLVLNFDAPRQLDILGITFCLMGVLALATATIIIRNSSKKNMLMIIGLQMLVGSITLFPLSIAFEVWYVNWTKSLILSFIYTTVFPGLVGTLIWFKLLHAIGPIKSAAFHFLNPFFGVFIAQIFLSETLLAQQLIGVFLVTAAILFLQISKIKKN